MSLLDDVSIVVTPNGYKAGELYAVVPEPTEGAEMLSQPVDLQTDFTTHSGGVIVDADTFTTSGGSIDGIKKSSFLTVGTRYKLIIEGNTTSSGFTMGNFSASGNEYGSGFGTHIFTASVDTTLWLRQNTAGTTNITSFSIKEYTSADMDVTRATAATRVDENGLVNYAEIIGSELVTNGDFELNSDWNNFGTPTTSEQSTEQSHTGTYSWKVIADATLEGIYSPNNFSLTSGLQYTVSLWVYSVSGTSIKSGLTNTNVSVFTVRTVTAGQWTNITYEATATSTGASYISILSENSLNFYVDDVTVKEVTRDNVPRIDYTGGGCPHILAEPQRTNLIPYSEDLTQWNKGNLTISSDAVVSPDGTQNADTLNVIDDNDFIYEGATTTASTEYVFSFYVKRGTIAESSLKLAVYDDTNNAFIVSDISYSSSDSEWTRVTQSFTTPVGCILIRAYAFRNSSTTLGTFSVWGAQVEEGSYATSYIPNFGTLLGVTRNKDIFTRDGIGSLINSTEGVLFIEMAALSDDGTDRRITLTDGTTGNAVNIGLSRFTSNINAEIHSGGSLQTSGWGGTGVTQTNNNKFALSWGSGTMKFYINGSPTSSQTGVTSPIGLNNLKFSSGDDTLNLFAKVKQLQVYDTSLSDTQLAALTS